MNKHSILWQKIKSLLNRPLYGIYVLIFIFACFAIFVTIEKQISDLFPNIVHYFPVVILSGASIIHIILVYLSMHEIEEKEEEWKEEYDGWIGTPFELILRWLIVSFLLWFSGKVFIDSIPSSLVGALVMGILLVWDFASVGVSKKKTWAGLLHPIRNIEAKFFWSDIIGALLWFLLYFENKSAISLIAYVVTILYPAIIIFRLYFFRENNYRFVPKSATGV